MRKRDREAIAVKLEKTAVEMHETVTAQVHGAAWYVRANATHKGFSFAHAALKNAESLVERLRIIVDVLDLKTR